MSLFADELQRIWRMQDDMSMPRLYFVDIALVINATERMKPILDEVKRNAINLCTKFLERMTASGMNVDELRIKVIPFRDYKYDDEHTMADSGFFNLPEQSEEFVSYINSIEAQGGGDGLGNALEALATAMQSDWTTKGGNGPESKYRRHIILLYTDGGAVSLGDEERTASPYYPANMPDSFEELMMRWYGETEEGGMPDKKAARLVIFAPEGYPWDKMIEWNSVWTSYSQAGIGLDEIEIYMANSMLTVNF